MGWPSFLVRLLPIVLAGCDLVLGLEPPLPGPDDAAPDAVGCSGVTFGGGAPLGDFEGAPTEFDPALSDDQLELWYARDTTSTAYDVFVRTRSSLEEPFGAEQPAPFNSDVLDSEPTLTLDGLRLMFMSTRGGDRRVYEVVRASPTDPFSQTPSLVRGIDGTTVASIDLSLDGLRLYFTDLDHALYAATRDTLDDPFTDPVLVGGAVMPPIRYHSLSPDELELFFNLGGTGQLQRRVRADRSSLFSPDTEELILASGSDPDVHPSSTMLVVAREGGLSMLTRVCP